MEALYKYILNMMARIDVMIDNADAYYVDDDDGWIWRKTPLGGYEIADNDIGHIVNAATECIDIILKHKKLK